ncbi:phosphodiester glycosidase family protein [Fodinicola feengrottensis]|uniref:phosphodiester glycosidase family protein n=1 Tax=Fodinicola feengrottensis TaxID=435914 RepID=UPI0013D83E79|nr:phosphodiester glycosidase family protein [Fodinicola feengrottensis]
MSARSRLTLRVATASALVVASLLVAVPASAQTATASDRSWLPKTPPGWQLVVDQSRTPSTTITKGVEQYGETYDTIDDGRQRSQVLDVNLADPNVHIGMVANDDRITDPANETISSMAARTHAIAGVNGDYFDINASGAPRGALIRDGNIVKSPRPNYNAQLGVRPDGSMVIGPQAYTATVTDGTNTHAVTSINVVGDLIGGGITRVTNGLGLTDRAPGTTSLPPSTLVVGHGDTSGFVVDSVQTGLKVLPALTADQQGLAGAGAGGDWLAATVKAGDKLTVSQKIAPDNDLTGLISGATQLVKDGKAYVDPTGEPPGGNNPTRNPETAVGLSKDGKHALVVVIDGRGADNQAVGVTPTVAAGYFVAHGVDSAILFDGGGSSEMIARRPGETTPAIMNNPSDGHERNVANGIFVYTTEKSASQARQVVINGGKPVVTVPNASVPLKVYATDSAGNPATGTNDVTVVPSWIASYENGTLTAHSAGTAVIVARNGYATSVQTVRVTDSLSSLAVSPPAPDRIANGDKVTFTLSGKSGSTDVQVPAEAAKWAVTPANLGTIDAHGVLTAGAADGGMATVTATLGGKTATASVAVGGESHHIADTADASAWSLRNTTTADATFTNAPGDVPPGSSAVGSMQVAYSIPRSPGVKQLVLSPKVTLSAPADANGRAPTSIGVWVKGDGKGIDLPRNWSARMVRRPPSIRLSSPLPAGNGSTFQCRAPCRRRSA